MKPRKDKDPTWFRCSRLKYKRTLWGRNIYSKCEWYRINTSSYVFKPIVVIGSDKQIISDSVSQMIKQVERVVSSEMFYIKISSLMLLRTTSTDCKIYSELSATIMIARYLCLYTVKKVVTFNLVCRMQSSFVEGVFWVV